MFPVPFSTALVVMYGAGENDTTTGVVSRSIFSCHSLASENDTTVPYPLGAYDKRRQELMCQLLIGLQVISLSPQELANHLLTNE
ncbi:hypothetical protein Tco_0349298 [Tanacetum coccineum]